MGLEIVANKSKEKLEDFTDKKFDEGVTIEELTLVKDCFNVGINVYSLQSAIVVCLTEKSTDRIVHLNLHERHFSYVRKFKSYAKKFQCFECNTLVKQFGNMAHQKKIRCNRDEVEEVFVGGKYRVPKTLFQLLEEIRIDVPEEDR